MPETKQEALAIANGICRMNATMAWAYAFTQGKRPEYGVNYGEFLWAGEEATKERFDAYIDLKTNKMVVL
jgi:hypothetical protein